MNKNHLLILLLISLPIWGATQVIHHWETGVLAEDNWKYFVGTSAPLSGWNQHGFNDQSWSTGPGGFGYDDGDDQTMIPATTSVYLRKQFTIIDTNTISAIALHADYDDGFVAYLNGVEICRANIGNVGSEPANTDLAATAREALLYQGGLPEVFPIADSVWKSILTADTNTLAIQVHNVNQTSSDLSALMYLMLGISDTTSAYRPVPSWFPKSLDSSNLPLLIVNSNGLSILDDPKVEVSLGIVDNGLGNINRPTDLFNGYSGKIGIETRGSSSQSFPKKGYGFETRKVDGSNNNIKLLGLPKENDWILHGPYSDKSLMRNVLAYHIGSITGEYAPRTRWCELIINGDYQGVYVLTEKIKRDKNRVDIDKLEPTDTSRTDITGGYLFSADRNEDGPGTGWSSPFTSSLFYRFRDPDHDELVQAQKDYLKGFVTQFAQTMNNSLSGDQYKNFIDIDSWVNYWLATEVFKHIDNYKYSFYMHKRSAANGGKIHFGPLWDLNLAFGNFDFVRSPDPQGWSYVWVNSNVLRPKWVLQLTDKPEIQNAINCRWQELRAGGLNTDTLINFIDSNAALIADAQTRNFNRWPVLGTYVWPNNYVGNTYNEELTYLKDWLRDRLTWMDNNMLGKCTAPLGQASKHHFQQIEVFPNPIGNEIRIQINSNLLDPASLIVFDALGRKVLEQVFQSATNNSVPFENQTAGIYFYQIKQQNRIVASGKLVKD